jgi:hypothetical protein
LCQLVLPFSFLFFFFGKEDLWKSKLFNTQRKNEFFFEFFLMFCFLLFVLCLQVIFV